MDIAMPVMDGFQATKQIRKQRPSACVLMLTGSNSRTDVDRARAAGAAGYVTKDTHRGRADRRDPRSRRPADTLTRAMVQVLAVLQVLLSIAPRAR